jgi:hypothetical protein
MPGADLVSNQSFQDRHAGRPCKDIRLGISLVIRSKSLRKVAGPMEYSAVLISFDNDYSIKPHVIYTRGYIYDPAEVTSPPILEDLSVVMSLQFLLAEQSRDCVTHGDNLMKSHVAFSLLNLAVLSLVFAYVATGVPGKLLAQANDGQSGASANTFELASGTAILGRLDSQLYTEHCSKGDRVEIQITHDVMQGHQTVLKKGARAVGKIVKLQTSPEEGGMYGVGILFDSMVLKNGDTVPLRMEIQAIAPPSAVGINRITDLPDGGGNQVNANQGAVEAIGVKRQDPVDLPGVALGIETVNGTHISILACKTGNIHLEKWSQIVLRVVNPWSY